MLKWEPRLRYDFKNSALSVLFGSLDKERVCPVPDRIIHFAISSNAHFDDHNALHSLGACLKRIVWLWHVTHLEVLLPATH